MEGISAIVPQKTSFHYRYGKIPYSEAMTNPNCPLAQRIDTI